MNVNPIFTPLLALFWSPPTPEKNMYLFCCSTHHYVEELDANFVYLLRGAEQVVYGGLIRVFL